MNNLYPSAYDKGHAYPAERLQPGIACRLFRPSQKVYQGRRKTLAKDALRFQPVSGEEEVCSIQPLRPAARWMRNLSLSDELREPSPTALQSPTRLKS